MFLKEVWCVVNVKAYTTPNIHNRNGISNLPGEGKREKGGSIEDTWN